MSTWANYCNAEARSRFDRSDYVGPGNPTYLHEWGQEPARSRVWIEWLDALGLGGQRVLGLTLWLSVDSNGQDLNCTVAFHDSGATQVPLTGGELVGYPMAEPVGAYEYTWAGVGDWEDQPIPALLLQSLQTVLNREDWDDKSLGLLIDGIEHESQSGVAGIQGIVAARPAYLQIDYEAPPPTGSYDVVGSVSVSVSRG